jgi:hypothetical protein
MKRFLPFHFLLFITLIVFGRSEFSHAQNTRKNDLIIKRDSVKVEALILEVEDQVIRYKKYSDQEGPVFSVNKSEVASIVYGNGEVENFNLPQEIYFDEAPAPVTPYRNSAPATSRPRNGSLESQNTDQLRTNYNFYLKKAARYKKINLIGVIGGVAFIGGGIGLISNGVNKLNLYGGNNGGGEIYGGTLMFLAGLGGGIPLTIVGAVKKRSYTKKALLVQEELRRRKAPLSVHINPVYNPANHSTGLSLRMTF